jgi:hypothetical protein
MRDYKRLQQETLQQTLRWQENFEPDGTPKPLRDPSDLTLCPTPSATPTPTSGSRATTTASARCARACCVSTS